MKIRVGKGTLLAAAAIGLGVPPMGASVVVPAVAADGGFTEVATLPGGSQSMVSPIEGQAYVAGVKGASQAFVTLYRGAQAQDVAIPRAAAPITEVKLDSAAGRTFLMVRTSGGAEIYALSDARATRLAPPATAPSTGGSIDVQGMAADETGLWLVGRTQVSGQAPRAVVSRWNGTAWTVGPALEGSPSGYYGYSEFMAKGGMLYVVQNWDPGKYGRTPYRYDGSAWTKVPGYSSVDPTEPHVWRAWTFASSKDYTVWGSEGPSGTTPPGGACMHVVDFAADACYAPAWPVSAAARLADGRVVLGGSDAERGAASPAPAGFAVTDSDGARPTPLAGDNDDRVAALSAPATGGTTVWALTVGATGSHLRRATLGPVVRPTAPPTSTSAAPTSPTGPTSTVTAPAPDPTSPTPVPPAIAGFARVATLPADPQSMASPADGQLYVLGTPTNPYLKLYTRDSVTDVPVTVPELFKGWQSRLTAGYGRTYLLKLARTDTLPSLLYQINGSSVSEPVKVPTVVPGTAFTFGVAQVAVDASGVWVVGNVARGSDTVLVAAHWDGSTWTWTPLAGAPVATTDGSGPAPVESRGGALYVQAGTMDGARFYRWDGARWTTLPGVWAQTTMPPVWSIASASDFSLWGGGAKGGSCTRIMGTTSSACPAPAWEVRSAATLGDGRVVLGGTSAGTVGASFGLVAKPGTRPVALAGDGGAIVQSLAAPRSGSTVWAMLVDPSPEPVGPVHWSLGIATLTPVGPVPSPTTSAPTPRPTKPKKPRPRPTWTPRVVKPRPPHQ